MIYRLCFCQFWGLYCLCLAALICISSVSIISINTIVVNDYQYDLLWLTRVVLSMQSIISMYINISMVLPRSHCYESMSSKPKTQDHPISGKSCFQTLPVGVYCWVGSNYNIIYVYIDVVP